MFIVHITIGEKIVIFGLVFLNQKWDFLGIISYDFVEIKILYEI